MKAAKSGRKAAKQILATAILGMAGISSAWAQTPQGEAAPRTYDDYFFLRGASNSRDNSPLPEQWMGWCGIMRGSELLAKISSTGRIADTSVETGFSGGRLDRTYQRFYDRFYNEKGLHFEIKEYQPHWWEPSNVQERDDGMPGMTETPASYWLEAWRPWARGSIMAFRFRLVGTACTSLVEAVKTYPFVEKPFFNQVLATLMRYGAIERFNDFWTTNWKAFEIESDFSCLIMAPTSRKRLYTGEKIVGQIFPTRELVSFSGERMIEYLLTPKYSFEPDKELSPVPQTALEGVGWAYYKYHDFYSGLREVNPGRTEWAIFHKAYRDPLLILGLNGMACRKQLAGALKKDFDKSYYKLNDALYTIAAWMRMIPDLNYTDGALKRARAEAAAMKPIDPRPNAPVQVQPAVRRK